MTAKWVQALLKGSVELSSSRSTFISGRFATPPTSTAAAPCGGLIAQYFEPRTGFQPFRHHSKATTAVRFQGALAASPAASPASPLAPAPYVSGGSLGAALDLGFSLNNVLNGIPGLTMQLGVAFKQQIPASPDVFRVDTKVEAFEGKTMQLTGIVRDGEGGEFAVGTAKFYKGVGDGFRRGFQLAQRSDALHNLVTGALVKHLANHKVESNQHLTAAEFLTENTDYADCTAACRGHPVPNGVHSGGVFQ